MNDIPIIMHRDFIARNIEMKDLKEYMNYYIEALETNNKNFDPALLKPEVFIEPKIDFITEVLRQSCLVSKKVLAVVDLNHVEMISERWTKLEPKIRNLYDCMLKVKKNEELTYLEYVEKQVLLDMIFDPFVRENWIKFKSFPFAAQDTIGVNVNKTNIFMIWDHYFRKYAKMINNRAPFSKKYVAIDPKDEILRGPHEGGVKERDDGGFGVEDEPGKETIKNQEFLKTRREGKIKI